MNSNVSYSAGVISSNHAFHNLLVGNAQNLQVCWGNFCDSGIVNAYLLVSSADNFSKQFGPKSVPTTHWA